MDVGELCNRSVATITPGKTLNEAAQSMRESHVGDLVVTEEGATVNKPIGIITDRDLVMAIAQSGPESFNKKSVRDEMSEVLILAERDDSIEEVLQNMKSNGIRRIPVVDSRDNLYGILSFDDLVGYFGDQIMNLGELVQAEIGKEITGRT